MTPWKSPAPISRHVPSLSFHYAMQSPICFLPLRICLSWIFQTNELIQYMTFLSDFFRLTSYLFFLNFCEAKGGRGEMPTSELLSSDMVSWELTGLFSGGCNISFVLHAIVNFFPHSWLNIFDVEEWTIFSWFSFEHSVPTAAYHSALQASVSGNPHLRLSFPVF